MFEFLEENSRLFNVAKEILFDGEGELVKSQCPEFELRRQKIMERFHDSVENAFKKVSSFEWEFIRKGDSWDLSTLLWECFMCREDLNQICFEMGMRSSFVLWQELSLPNKQNYLVPKTNEGDEQTEFDLQNLLELLSKKPDEVTMEEIEYLSGFIWNKNVRDFFLRIPELRRDRCDYFCRLKQYFKIVYTDGEVSEIIEDTEPFQDYVNFTPEEKRRFQSKIKYRSLHRDIIINLCKEWGIKFTRIPDNHED